MTRSLCLTLLLISGCLPTPQPVRVHGDSDHGRRIAVVECVADKMTDERLAYRLEVHRLLRQSNERAGLEIGGWPELSRAMPKIDTGKDGVPIKLTPDDRKSLAIALRKATRGLK